MDADKYDIPSAIEGADPYEIVQGVGHAAEETLMSVGDLLGGETGTQIAVTAVDGIHAAMEYLAGVCD